MKTCFCDNHTNYDFQCPKCGTKYKAIQMPDIEIMKQIGHLTTCPKCGMRISIIGFKEE